MVFQRIKVYPFITPQKKGTFTMMKKLISMLLSLLLCISVLSTQALAAADSDENNPPPRITETPAPNEPDEPDNPITVMCMTPGYTGSGEQPVD